MSQYGAGRIKNREKASRAEILEALIWLESNGYIYKTGELRDGLPVYAAVPNGKSPDAAFLKEIGEATEH
jgi:hypothetical protein